MPAAPPPPHLTDLKAGSEIAWSDAVGILGPPLRGFISMRGARDPDATVGDVFLELARGIDRLEGDWDSFRTLAFVIARRRVVDDIRSAVRRPSSPVDVRSLENGLEGGDVEQEAMDRLAREWLLDLLNTLTPIQRDILTMRFVAGLSIREVAGITGATETGVKANQRRALAALRRHLSAPDTSVANSPLGEIAAALGVQP